MPIDYTNYPINWHDAKMRHRNRAARENREREKHGQLRLFGAIWR